MIKKFIFLSLLFVSSSCTSSYFNYINSDKSKLPANPKFYVRAVGTGLNERKMFPLSDIKTKEYLTEKEVNDLTKEEIVAQLKKENLYSEALNEPNVFECDFHLNYVRTFFMFTNDKYAGTSLMGYGITIFKSGKEVASRNESDEYIVTNGSLGFKGVGRILFWQADKEDEKKQIGIFAHTVANNLNRFGK